jgi:hypothetical protein
MKGLLTLVAKVAASSAVVGGALAFLVFFGPRPTPAYADIYAPLAQAAGFLPPPPGGGPTLRVGRALVNGQRFEYAIGRSRLKLDDVMSHFERQFQTRTSAKGDAFSTAARVQGAGAAAIAGLRFGPLLPPAEFSSRLQAFTASGRLGELGQFHLVSAYEQKGTVFIDFASSDDLRIDRLLPVGSDDAPGEDLGGVIRPTGLQRLLTIEHGEGNTWSRTWIFRASDGADAAARYAAALTHSGWTPNPAFASPDVAHFSNGQAECFLAGAGTGSNAALILVLRRV